MVLRILLAQSMNFCCPPYRSFFLYHAMSSVCLKRVWKHTNKVWHISAHYPSILNCLCAYTTKSRHKGSPLNVWKYTYLFAISVKIEKLVHVRSKLCRDYLFGLEFKEKLNKETRAKKKLVIYTLYRQITQTRISNKRTKFDTEGTYIHTCTINPLIIILVEVLGWHFRRIPHRSLEKSIAAIVSGKE